jgi:hypothetical protein
MMDRDIKKDIERSEIPDFYKPGDIVKVHASYGPEYCRRVDGTGSSWSVVKGTAWYVVEINQGLYDDCLHIDDRNRPELDGKPAFRAYVHKVNIEPYEEKDETTEDSRCTTQIK